MKIGTLCYVNDGKRTLMLHRIKKENDIHDGKWNGLGGKLIDGESPEECVIREVKEESGLDIKNPTLKGILTFPKFDEVDDWMVFVFVSNEFSGELSECDEGVLEWVDNNKIHKLNLWSGDKIYMKWLMEHPFFSAKFIYEKRILQSHDVVFYK